MDKGQILCDYRTAKNHKKQIPILAELNACSKEEIIDILTEGGYTRTFNTNGVDISVKRKEIEDRYANGDDVATLAMAYHISKKAIRTHYSMCLRRRMRNLWKMKIIPKRAKKPLTDCMRN